MQATDFDALPRKLRVNDKSRFVRRELRTEMRGGVCRWPALSASRLRSRVTNLNLSRSGRNDLQVWISAAAFALQMDSGWRR